MAEFEKDVLNEIEMLFNAHKYGEALLLVNAELSVPYVEKNFRSVLEQKKEQAETILMLNQADTIKLLSYEEVYSYLFENKEYSVLVITFLHKSNIRDYLEVVQKYLLWDEKDKVISSLLIHICIEQQVMDELKMAKDDLEISFIPHYLELPDESIGYQLAVRHFEKWFGNEEVNLVYMCNEVLKEETLLMLPFALDEDESLLVALAIAWYVHKAWSREAEFMELLAKEGITLENLPSLEIENA
jgi:hypothetical protein